MSKRCCRSNAVTITLFVAPQALLMQVPLIGPLVYVPMQYAAAWLLDTLLTDAPTRPPIAGAAAHSQVVRSSLACAHCSGCTGNADHDSSTGRWCRVGAMHAPLAWRRVHGVCSCKEKGSSALLLVLKGSMDPEI